jgi:hypothetical protein
VFMFVLAIAEAYAFLALRYFTLAKGTIPGCPTHTDCIPSAIGMTTRQEQLDCVGGVGCRNGGYLVGSYVDDCSDKHQSLP